MQRPQLQLLTGPNLLVRFHSRGDSEEFLAWWQNIGERLFVEHGMAKPSSAYVDTTNNCWRCGSTQHRAPECKEL